MPPRIAALLPSPITFAHRGARANAPENTLEAFSLARRLGASGLESDVWLTADGEAVLDHDGVVRTLWVRRRPISHYRRQALPSHIPTVDELYQECGADFDLSLDLKDRSAASAVVASADRAADALGRSVRDRLWLVHPDWELLAAMREQWPEVRLVNCIRLASIADGPERRAAQLADAGIDAINMHYSDWSGGLTTLFHRFGVLAFAWDAQHERVLRELLDMGVDAVYSDYVDRMVDAQRAAYG